MATASKRAVAAKTVCGELLIARHYEDSGPVYAASFRDSAQENAAPKTVRLRGGNALIEFLEKLEVDFRKPEIKRSLEDLLLLGHASLADVSLLEEDLYHAGLI
jgi:hypothetical protein